MTLEEGICLYAQKTPDKTAVICYEDKISYSDLWNMIIERAGLMNQDGLRKGMPYVFRASQDIDFIINYCAIHYLGAIAVPLEHQAVQENFISIQKEVGRCDIPADIQDILYTTGTTGKSKGVMLSRTALESCADNFICDMHYTDKLLYIISGPLNHIASLFKIHPMLIAGGTVCILDGLKDINAFFDVFRLPYNKVATFMVPASLRLLMEFSYDKLCAVADRIDFIETGAAPITGKDMERLAKALPHSRLYNTLGGTEIGAVCTYDFNDGKYMEGCIGRPMKNSLVEVTPDGSIIVSGPTVMSGYVNDPESTAQVLQDGRITTSDLGYVDENGMIHLKGRRGDVINVGGFKVDPLEVENAAIGHESVKECICIAAEHPVIGPVLKLLVVLEDGFVLDKRSLAIYLKSKLEPHKIPTYYEAVDKLQLTYNGKLDRKYYRIK